MSLTEWKEIMANKPEPDEIVWYEMEGYFRVRWGNRTCIYPIKSME